MTSAKKGFTVLAIVATFFGIIASVKAASPNNSTPILFAPDAAATAVVAGNGFSFTLVGFDLDTTDVLSYSASNLPTGATLDSATGLFTWLTNSSQAGTYTINFTVSDGIDSNTLPVTLTVNSSVVNPPTSDDHDSDDDDKEESDRREDRREDRRRNRGERTRTDRSGRN